MRPPTKDAIPKKITKPPTKPVATSADPALPAWFNDARRKNDIALIRIPKIEGTNRMYPMSTAGPLIRYFV